MDRRTAFTQILKATQKNTASATVVFTGLEPYEGPWAFEQAAHLLRRTTFAPTKATIQEALAQGLDATIIQLFSATLEPAPPIYYDTEQDPNVPLGETWVDAPLIEEVNLTGNRRRSLRAWTMKLINEEGISVREKLSLFWVNHFAIQGVNDMRVSYQYISLIKNNVWGNFRQLIKEMTVNHAMLRFLNGNTNRVGSPNENYAREVLELFTIGKGPIAGPGDYTYYTEEDVVQMARILTGWRTRGYNTQNPEISPSSYFQPNRHDTGDKQLSHRFDNVVVSDMGADEYSHLIDIIFGKDEVARNICRQLYQWFVYYKIDDITEEMIIEPLAQILIENDYELKPVLETLFRSTHFFDILNVGPMIKNPLSQVIGIVKENNMPFSENWRIELATYNHLYIRVRNIGMDYYAVPQVAGWKAYYQSPLFYRNWINSTSLQLRSEFASRVAANGYSFMGEGYKLDHLSFIASLEDPLDPNTMIAEIVKLMLPQPLHESQLSALKELLIPGLPDFEWTVGYTDHLNNPDDEELRAAVNNKLQAFFQGLFSMAEYQLS